MEIGVYTFGEAAVDGAGERLRHLIEEIELADQVGLDVFGVGEHHRPDFAVTSPAIVLAAAAERTERIRLTSAVSVISSDDPIRVFQDFATIDLLSGGRAEIMAGRGSFIESFPLFGYDLDDYDELFQEKLELLLEARANEIVYWPGSTHTQRIENRGVYPRPIQDPLPVWIAVGGTPQSVARAGILGLPLAVAIIGGQPARFALPVSINSHAFVADTSQKAADVFYPGYAEVMSRIGRERGWPPLTRDQFEAGRRPGGHLLVGSPQEVTEKILEQYEIFHHDRFLAQLSVGPMPHAELMRAIELLGTEVAPAVRAEVATRRSSTQLSGLR
jgi:alkanesulfonate monooxygenase SsuD/methylene tetrahydromethanopterin reductase-like flavin-dependent oxidoreductase (luciferase family)